MTSTALADAARQATDLALVAGPLAVWDPNRPDNVHLAVVGRGLLCTILRGTLADRQPGGHLPVSVEWCWEPAADNPPTCAACLWEHSHLVAWSPDGRLPINPETARRLLANLTSSTR